MRYRLNQIKQGVQTRLKDMIARPHPDPIVVFGKAKAGTTVIAELLSKASGRSYSHDMLYRRNWDRTPDLHSGAYTIQQLMRRFGSEFSAGVIKEPNFTFVADQVIEALPGCRPVFAVRKPASNIRSILSRLKIPGDVTDVTISDYPELLRSPQWQEMFDPKPLGLKPGTLVEILAQRWCLTTEAYLRQGDRAVAISYEAFQADKVREIEACLRRCGMPVMQDVSAFVDVQYQPAGAQGKVEAFFSEENLSVIEEICGSLDRKLDQRLAQTA